MGEAHDGWTPPAAFEEYELVRPLGRGAMGAVYLARDTLLERMVALKFVAGGEPDAGVRQRFFIEARAVARLQHPNVVSVFRVGEIERRPYLVSELVHGRTLAEITRPLPWRQVLSIGIGLARGLAAAHRSGVLHRDIKPTNAMVTDDGVVKLLDFGVAELVDAPAPAPGRKRAPASVDATITLGDAPSDAAGELGSEATGSEHVGRLVGSPLYLAPEIWAGASASRRSDLYSLGVVLYELGAGRAPHQGHPVEELGRLVREVPAPPLVDVSPAFEPRLARVIHGCLAIDPSERFDSADALRDALEAIEAAPRAGLVPPGNPFRGLRSYRHEHRAVFFGRGTETRAVIERLRASRFVVVAGDSGVGKSSLCRAAVAPAVADGALDDGRSYVVARVVPGDAPLARLAAALVPWLGAAAELDPESIGDPDLPRRLRARLGDDGGLLLLVDQLEELLTMASPEDAATFGAVIARISGSGAPVRILACVRADFLGRVAALPGMGEELTANLYVLRPLSVEGMRDAVLGPVRAKGIDFDGPEMIDALVSAGLHTSGGLPLLQFALAELWEARDRRRRIIPAEALARMGGVEGALARHADEVLRRLTPQERRAARAMLVGLVGVGGTRLRRRDTELLAQAGGAEVAAGVLNALVVGRLLVAREDPTAGGTTYEIAHEALVDGWDRLRAWLGQDAGRRLAYQRVQRAAEEWARLGRPAEMLWGRAQLAELAAVEVPSVAADFVARSRRAVRRRMFLRGAIALVAVASVAAGLVVAQVRHDRHVAAAVAAHQRDADEELRAARTAAAEAAELREAAYRSFAARRRDEGERRWTSAVEAVDRSEEHYWRASRALESALLIDPERDELRGLFADVLYEQALLARVHRTPHRYRELVERLSAYDDGSRMRYLESPAVVHLATEPAGARVVIREAGERGEGRALGAAPLRDELLRAGSYVLELHLDGRAEVRLPLLVEPGERLELTVPLPPAEAVPPGFVYVPPGRFLFGSDDAEDVRLFFFDAPPMHEVTTGAYLIGRTEVTFAEWIEFLRALPEDERRVRTPSARSPRNALELRQVDGDDWELSLRPTERTYVARMGEPIVYPGRQRRASQDWLRFPVAAVSYDDARAFAAWLDRTGRVPGARLCTEWEWARAARGADDRRFPGGDRMEPDDANFDVTYGRHPLGFGPDEVGSHPASRSPFGVDDLAGNVWEWVESSAVEGEAVYRGGSWYQGDLTCRIVNREVGEPTLRDPLLGFRVCADLP